MVVYRTVDTIGCGAAEGGSPGREPWECADDDCEAAEQRRLSARLAKINVAAPQLLCTMVTMTCGFTAGYRPPLLRSESHRDYQQTDGPLSVVCKVALQGGLSTLFTQVPVEC